jgi:hypothetical protein
MASQEYAKAVEQNGKATTAEERKAAEARMKAAEERLSKANKTNQDADEVVKKAAERMAAAKQGKDPGAVAAGSPAGDRTASTPTPESSGKPATASGPQEGVKTDAAMAKYLQTIALIESGGDKNAKAGTSSASGMFQFVEGTWKQMTKEMGKDYSLQDRFDPKKAAEVAEYFSKKQKTQIEKSTGREAGMTDMYMAHFLGAGGAGKFLKAKDKDPSQSAAALDPAAAKANKNNYYDKTGKERTVQEVYDLMDKKVKAQSARVEQGKVNADVAAIGGGSFKPGQKVDAVAVAKPKEEKKPETKVESGRTGDDSRRTDKPVTAETKPVTAETKPVTAETKPVTAEPRREETLQSMIRDGITPTTIAFQELINKGIKPFQSVMATGVQITTPLNQVNPKDSLSKGEEIISSAKAEQMRMLAEAEKRGPDRIQMPNLSDITKMSEAVQPKDIKNSNSFETPKTEIIAQAEKAAAEKAAAKEKEMAEKDAMFKDAMAKAQPSNQEGALSGSSEVNTALAELIAISKRTAELNERQLSVQSSLGGDLFA